MISIVWYVGRKRKNFSHLFKDCNGFRAFVFVCSWGGRSDAWPMNDVLEIFEACINPPARMCCGVEDRTSVSCFLASLLYSFWSFRNDQMFEGKTNIMKMRRLVDQFMLDFFVIMHYPPPLDISSSDSGRP